MADYLDAAITQVFSTPSTRNAWVNFDAPPGTSQGFKRIQTTSTDGVTNTFVAASFGFFFAPGTVRVTTDANDEFIVAIRIPTDPLITTTSTPS